MIKKTILLLLLSVSLTSVQAQTFMGMPLNPMKNKPAIVSDAINSEGYRVVTAQNRAINKVLDDREENAIGSVLVYPYALQKDDYTVYKLALLMDKVNRPISVDSGTPVLLKTKSGEVYELAIDNGDSDNLGKVERYMSYVYTRYKITPTIVITPEIVQRIKDEGITKIRFELNGDICDVNFKKDNISQFIYDEFILIQEALKSKRSFSDDF